MNGILIIDKPEGFTSHDVIGKLKGILKEKRIGHGGTLDPMATGVLPVFIGRATRAVEFCESDDKEYLAGLRTGIVTDTQDITGTVIRESKAAVSRGDLVNIISFFIGEQEQIPPMYSAVKIKGQKLYRLARRGIEVKREPRKITVKSLEIVGETPEGFLLKILCTKGTYVRTLCHDIGERLGCGAAISSLRRLRAGRFHIDMAVSLQEAEKAAGENKIDRLIMPVDTLFSEYPSVKINEEQTKKCKNGNDFIICGTKNGTYRVYDEGGGFLMLGRAENGVMRTLKSFFEVDT